ncbi:hypothetical protein AQ610_26405 [Burkholderia humptydooensis]|uniref:Uncharacterized protein n=1 Tax=Burkholderia humptydooensis MSMB43 TaxID=441157 RepID=A0ABN0G3X1_9BURK|nr:hypothetical protein AQ610_26405 [Burkholderia humptydooensis]EIP86942.1 hypothetical protein A33K_16545 [Burkholderia humptydooensis MSMB43]
MQSLRVARLREAHPRCGARCGEPFRTPVLHPIELSEPLAHVTPGTGFSIAMPGRPGAPGDTVRLGHRPRRAGAPRSPNRPPHASPTGECERPHRSLRIAFAKTIERAPSM